MTDTPDNKRPVRVTLSRFTGLGRHVHVEVREEPDADGNGVLRVMSFLDRGKALDWVRHVFNTEFSQDSHTLVFERGRSRRWFYPEGD